MTGAEIRVGAVVSHPVHYMVPFFRRLHATSDLDLTVLYISRAGTAESNLSSPGYGRRVVWGNDLLEGYAHEFVGTWRADPAVRRTMVAPRLTTAIDVRRFDVLVNFGWQYPANAQLMVAARRRRIPVLLYTDTDVHERAARGPRQLRRVLLSRYCTAAAGALYTGTFNRDFYIRHGMLPEQLWFSPWAVDNRRFGRSDRTSARASLGLRDDVVYCLFVGQLVPRKNVRALIDAVGRLQAAAAPVGLLIAGSGPLDQELRLRSARLTDVHWLGFVSQDRLPQLYGAADVFVLPSFADPRATVVNEAMASGLAVIVSAGAGVWGPLDLVRNGQDGLVFDPHSAGQLEGALRRLLDRAFRAQLAQSAQKRAQLFSYDRAAQGWMDACRALVVRRAGSV